MGGGASSSGLKAGMKQKSLWRPLTPDVRRHGWLLIFMLAWLSLNVESSLVSAECPCGVSRSQPPWAQTRGLSPTDTESWSPGLALPQIWCEREEDNASEWPLRTSNTWIKLSEPSTVIPTLQERGPAAVPQCIEIAGTHSQYWKCQCLMHMNENGVFAIRSRLPLIRIFYTRLSQFMNPCDGYSFT